MTQRLVIEWDPYEHADDRTVTATQTRLADRITNMIAGWSPDVVQHLVVKNNDAVSFEVAWDEWQ